jgi:hypothetical protein
MTLAGEESLGEVLHEEVRPQDRVSNPGIHHYVLDNSQRGLFVGVGPERGDEHAVLHACFSRERPRQINPNQV